MHRNRVSGGWLVAGALLVSGCATVKSHWPFGSATTVAPQPVSELALLFPGEGVAPTVLQFRERNTLVVDLQGVDAAGQVVLVRRAGDAWPARIAVRMAPRRFQTLEIRGAQRLVVPVSSAAGGAVTAELPPGTYDQGTPQLTISWGASNAF